MSVRVGVVSFAHVHAPQYAAVLASLDSADFVGVADGDASRGREAAQRFDVRYFEEARALFEAVDAVVVCSENKNHAGEIVRSGGIGRVLAVNGTNHGQRPNGWFLDPELAGGGAVMDHTVHVADALRWMLGAEAKNVYAEIGSFFGAEDIDDGAILTLEFEGGVIADGAFATIDPSWSRGEGYPTWGDVTLRITGTSGVLDVDAFAQHLTTFDREAGNASWTYTGEDMNALMLEDFLRGVAEGSPSGASGVDGLRALEIVLSAYRSAEDNELKVVERTEMPGS